ncbi:MAG: LysR family transcriptional regulator [Oscillospiraceae bacterium]|nr:LysR family transcriptional regulator [Oscillospiraceae bacterium]MCD8256837.1 LysR family transcriptional regulator [Oscillospiraceae bacterium]
MKGSGCAVQLKQLAYFAAVVEHGSFTRAAASLYLAQSSLSQSVQALEQELGFVLLKRGRSGVAPTEMGRLVYRDVKGLLASMEELTQSWKAAYQTQLSLHASLRIGVVPGAHPILMHLVLDDLRETYPNIRFRVLEARDTVLPAMLAAGQADLILCDVLQDKWAELEAYAQAQKLELTVLREDAYKIAVGAACPLAAKDDLCAQDVRGIPLACYSGGDAAAERFFARFFDPAISVEYTSIEKMIQIAKDGQCVSVLPELTIQNTLALSGAGRDALRFLTVEGFCVPFVHFAAVRLDAEQTTELALVLQKIQQVFREELTLSSAR